MPDTAATIPARRPGLEDAVLATIRRAGRHGITPAALSAAFGGRAVSSQCSRLVTKKLIERRAGAFFALKPAPIPVKPAPALFVAESQEGTVIGSSPILGAPVEEVEIIPRRPAAVTRAAALADADEAGDQDEVSTEERIEPLQPHPLVRWLDQHRAALSTVLPASARAALELLVVDAEINSDLIEKGEAERLLVMDQAADLRNAREMTANVPGPNLLSRIGYLLSVEADYTSLRKRLESARIAPTDQPVDEVIALFPTGTSHLLILDAARVHEDGRLDVFCNGAAPAAGAVGQLLGAVVVILPAFRSESA